ncbi:MAG TPA: YCF48-related protein [Noviherbaspirillum sp.]|uniref:WD40/YVTN/BNR-like repeat-containing protein n=1 Tax=Noviherbaspirillum sp. TaxID=1926288 RepID=UPI002B494832|nr:YCF48-related protein [Noviherbaspirillum sp.]HJV86938.1 YCF48-related protein [Noviherbaspirillum sp.]
MKSIHLPRFTSVLAALLAAFPLVAGAAPFRDVLDTPAKDSRLASRSLLNAVARAGKRLVAVGQRGHIIFSDDGGNSWRQAKVPVSADLVAVSFPTPQKGWAVGHDGVVLHSEDGGISWTKQLDGRAVGKLMVSYYEERAAKGSLTSPEAALLDETRRIASQGAENSFLDVWFANESTGFIVGAFNLIFRTADGGRTWEPWFHRTENPKRLHLYAIREAAGELYISGEQGIVLKLDQSRNRFVALNTGYGGTFFGLAGSDDAVIVYGLRGNAFRSTDGGKQWHKIEAGLQDGITGAASCGGRQLILVSQSGHVLASDDAGENFRHTKLEQAVPASAALCIGGNVAVIAGTRGITIQAFK